jgi:hypothetical protein
MADVLDHSPAQSPANAKVALFSDTPSDEKDLYVLPA